MMFDAATMVHMENMQAEINDLKMRHAKAVACLRAINEFEDTNYATHEIIKKVLHDIDIAIQPLTYVHKYWHVPTEDMCNRARGFILGLEIIKPRTWVNMHQHLAMGGYHTLPRICNMAVIDPNGHITKWDIAECIYMLMTNPSAQPSKENP